MIGAAPSFTATEYFTPNPSWRLSADAPDKYKDELESFMNDDGHLELWKALHPEIENPFYTWEGEVVEKGTHSDGGPGSGNHNHKGRPGKRGGSAPSDNARQPVTASNISKTYDGPKDTKSIVEAQGFGGLPKIVQKEEFDAAVKKSKFIAQRTYSASSQEVLDAYRDQLYNGDFYVDCSVGGSQYGQGMYCAADYEGKLSDGIKEEMDHYKQLGNDRFSSEGFGRTLTKKDFESSYYCRNIDISDAEYDVFVKLKSNPNLTGYKLPENEKKIWNEMLDNGKWRAMNNAHDDFLEQFEKEWQAPNYVETFTLAPDAKIITYDDIRDIQYGSGNEASEAYKRDFMLPILGEKVKELGINDTEIGYLKAKLGLFADYDEQESAVVEWKKLPPEVRNGVVGKYKDSVLTPIREAYNDHINEIRDMDTGALAAMLGYDAINAEGHGSSGSYTVILNRTKVIFLDDRDRKDADDEGEITFQTGEDGIQYAIRNRKVIGYVIVSDGNQPKE